MTQYLLTNPREGQEPDTSALSAIDKQILRFLFINERVTIGFFEKSFPRLNHNTSTVLNSLLNRHLVVKKPNIIDMRSTILEISPLYTALIQIDI